MISDTIDKLVERNCVEVCETCARQPSVSLPIQKSWRAPDAVWRAKPWEATEAILGTYTTLDYGASFSLACGVIGYSSFEFEPC